MTIFDRLPDKLKQHLDELMSDNQEIVTTYSDDAITWIYTPNDLDTWLVIIQWYDGSDKFDIVNLTGQSHVTTLAHLLAQSPDANINFK